MAVDSWSWLKKKKKGEMNTGGRYLLGLARGLKVKASGEHAEGNLAGVNRREQTDGGGSRAISASR